MTRPRPVDPAGQPLYARILCLRHLAPSSLLCFVFLEGAVVLGLLLALAELVSWWGVLVLPFTVALMVKFNDLVAGASTTPPVDGEAASVRASVLRPAAMTARAAAAHADSPALESPADSYRPPADADGSGPTATARTDHAGALGTFGSPASARSAAALSGHGDGHGMSSAPFSGHGDGRVTSGAFVTGHGDEREASGAFVTGYGDGRDQSGASLSGHSDGRMASGAPDTGYGDGIGASDVPFVIRADGAEVVDVSGRRTEEFERPGGFAPVVSRDPSAMGYGPVATPEFMTDGYRHDGMAEVPVVGGITYASAAEGRPYAAARSHPYSSADRHPYGGADRHPYSGADRHPYENHGLPGEQAVGGSFPVRPSGYPAAGDREARPAVGSAPSNRPRADQLDVRQQMARQAAARRYE
ncbi:hypothetical protein [Actinoplanes derwentensis]|uniref:Uncharacterized protein n=1 Tax=Actinoplanes derwentensis TaxID=113562 RepID=A0A1H2CB08_9ACTN|nr:hypothetical protein Ade03nite_70950 [Actinoplanes derwentensis]SDT67680.1 hypothetical protein SAMN04489716_5509 [Actinoplanes derwentensis]